MKVALLVYCLFSVMLSYAKDVPLRKEGRLNMGYYFYSINETVNRADVEVTLNFWAKDLFEIEGKKHNFAITSSKATLYEDILAMKQDFINGELDMIIAPPMLIAKYFNRSSLRDGFMGVLEDKKPEYLYLIVNADKNINSIRDLSGKRLVLQGHDETAEIFLDRLVLKEFKKSYKEINLILQSQKKSNRIVLDVFFKNADAAVVYGSAYDTMVELNPQIKNKVKILAFYPLKSKNFSYFRHDYPLIKELNEAAMTFENTPRGKQILEIFKTPNIDYCKVDDLDVFDHFYQDYLDLKKTGR